jgi:signal transduction histidine kinase
LQRRLHDGASLHISALVPQLGVLRDRLRGNAELESSIDDLQDQLHAVLQELRAVAAEIYPPLLDEGGLGPALGELAAGLPVPVRVQAPEDRFGPVVEGAVYFAVVDLLADLSLAGPPAGIALSRRGNDLVLALDGLADGSSAAAVVLDRVRPLGGTARADGATVRVSVPCG